MPQLDFFFFLNTEIFVILFAVCSLFGIIIKSFYMFNQFIGIQYMTNYSLKFMSLVKRVSFKTVWFSAIDVFSYVIFLSSAIPLKPTTLVGFQNPASQDMAAIMCTHNDMWYVLAIILFLVSWFLGLAIHRNSRYVIPFYDGQVITTDSFQLIAERFECCSIVELVWTTLPTGLLGATGYPGVSLLYTGLESSDVDFCIKVTGNQWYWTYEYVNYSNQYGQSFSYDSTMLDEPRDILKTWEGCEQTKILAKLFKHESIKTPDVKLKFISVDRPLVLPAYLPIHAIITSADVLHSWSIPALGVKVDACPGRFNKIIFKADLDSRLYQRDLNQMYWLYDGFSKYLGIEEYMLYRGYWGQCSEFCGVGHGFMPIVVHAIDSKDFVKMFDYYLTKLKPTAHKRVTYLRQKAGIEINDVFTRQYPDFFFHNYPGEKVGFNWSCFKDKAAPSGRMFIDELREHMLSEIPDYPCSTDQALSKNSTEYSVTEGSCKTKGGCKRAS